MDCPARIWPRVMIGIIFLVEVGWMLSFNNNNNNKGLYLFTRRSESASFFFWASYDGCPKDFHESKLILRPPRKFRPAPLRVQGGCSGTLYGTTSMVRTPVPENRAVT